MYERCARLHRRSYARRGVAATELAICMPVIVLIVIATIEACAMIFLQQSLSVAAYEGARVSLTPGVEAKNVVYQCELILDDRGVQGSTVEVTPSNIPNAKEGSWITVQTSTPFAQNSLVGGWLFGNRTLSAEVQMMKER